MRTTMKNVLAATMAAAALALACLTLLPGAALAAEGDAVPEVSLSASDGSVAVALKSFDPKADVRGLQLSLEVKTVGNVKDVAFTFDDALAATVAESRYHEDSGLLTLYITSKENLFTSGDLKLGTVTAAAADAESSSFSVEVIANGLKVVDGTRSASATLFNSAPSGDVVLNAGSTGGGDAGGGSGGSGDAGGDAGGGAGGSGDAGSDAGKDDAGADSGSHAGQDNAAAGQGGIASLLTTGDGLAWISLAVCIVAGAGIVAVFVARRMRRDR